MFSLCARLDALNATAQQRKQLRRGRASPAVPTAYLQVPMDNAILVAVMHTLQDLQNAAAEIPQPRLLDQNLPLSSVYYIPFNRLRLNFRPETLQNLTKTREHLSSVHLQYQVERKQYELDRIIRF